MGSQTSKSESNQTNSFIHQRENLNHIDSLNLDDSRESSIASSLVDSSMPEDPNIVTVTLK